MTSRHYNALHRPSNPKFFLWDRNGQYMTKRTVADLLFAAQGPTCYVCEKHMARDMASIDHVVPINLGGAHALWNFALAHRQCNLLKADHPPERTELRRHARIQKKLNRLLRKAARRRLLQRLKRLVLKGRWN